MERFHYGFVLLLIFHCSLSLAVEELQYNKLGQLEFGCPLGWKIYETNCYLMVDSAMEYEDAVNTCESFEANSLHIEDDIENKKIAEFAKNSSWTRFWNGQKFNDSTKCAGIWDDNQPPGNAKDGDCVSVNENGWWKVIGCQELLPFICKTRACIRGTSYCGKEKCINSKWFCDGVNDCSNNLDEMNCPDNCSYYNTSDTGSITQGSYKANADCFWTIEGPVGSQLKLTFSQIRTEEDRDVIEVWGGSKSMSGSIHLKTLSGSLNNIVVYSTNNFVIIRFRSDATVESSGFKVTWTSAESELSKDVIEITASDEWQDLSSPFYSDTPPYGFSRKWLITADSILTLEIVDIDLKSTWELSIYDGDSYTEKPIRITKSSESRSPALYISSENKIRINLKGLKITSGKGIKMRVKKGCNVEIQQECGEIFSPGYLKNKYPTSTKCSWTVKAPDSNKKPMLLKFIKFNLADDTDVVKVYNGADTTYPAIHEGDGFKENLTDDKKVVTGGDTIHLTFTSSLIQADGGFKIEFSIDCPTIPQSANMSCSSNLTNYESEVTVTCDEGYSFVQEEFYQKDSLQISCLKGGKWNITRYPTCQIVYCGVPKAIDNGFLANYSGSVTYGAEATYQCYSGFQRQNSAKVTCLKTGEWETPPTCQSSKCPAAPDVDKAEKKTVVCDGTASGSIVNYTCSEGYELLGPLQILCTSYGNWSHDPPKCKKIKCPMPKILNGELSSTDPVEFDTSVTLTCDSGYKTDKVTLKCLASSQLETSTCKDNNECDDSSTCSKEGQKCVNTIGSFYCECKDGYRKSGDCCDDIDECTENNSGCSHNCSNTTPFYSCTCNEGYVLFSANGTMNRFIADGETGLKLGDVYHINHTCVPVTCNRTAEVDNGTIHSKRSVFYFEDTIEFSCKLGWILKGSSNRICLSDGTWNGTQPVCEAVTCSRLEPNGTDIQKSRVKNVYPNSSVSFGDEVKLECLLGNGLRINKTLYCEYDSVNKNYLLQGDDPTCPVVDCRQPVLISGAIQPTVSDTTVNNSFEFECKSGVHRTGLSSDGNESTVTCQSNGRWGYGNLTCEAGRCSDPGTPGGGIQIVDGYEGGHFVSYNCTRDGYTPDPPEPIFCVIGSGGDANWNGTMPRCKDTTAPQFTNCPVSDMVIDSLDIPDFDVPNATDNSGFVKSISVSPDNFDKQKPVRTAINVTYTATDGEGNTNQCTVKIVLKDRGFPSLTCPDFLTLNITDTESRDINISQYITSDSTLEDVPTITVSFSTYGQTQDIRVSAMSKTKVKSVCAFQVKIAATKCFVEIENSLTNADVSHVKNDDGTINSTTVTCKQGYAFSDGNTSLTYSCTGQNEWTPDLPLKDCFRYQDAIYTYKFNVLYESSGRLNKSCSEEHDQFLKTFINSSDNHLNKAFCKKDYPIVFAFYALSVTTEMSYFKLNTTFLISVVDFDGNYVTELNDCVDDFKKDYKKIFKYPHNISCGAVTVKGGEGLLKNGPSCNGGLQLVTVAESRKCFPCEPGTYSINGECVKCNDGEYQDETGKTSCKSCPDNKTSVEPRISLNQCINGCIDGFYSTSGMPPCTACPLDSYWENSTHCEKCSGDGSTLSVEGAKIISECKAVCPAGSYSITGYEPCKKCPKNFYSTETKQMSCIECESNESTVSDGSAIKTNCTSIDSCSDCSGHGTCEIINHEPFCNCSEGFSGTTCNTTINFCLSNPCENGGTCSSNETGFTCTCKAATECSMSEEGHYVAGDSLDEKVVADMEACKSLCNQRTDCFAAAYYSGNKFCVLYDKTQTDGKRTDSDYIWLSKTCTHKYYYNGSYCERDLRNDCTSESCSEEDMCMDLINTTQCICPASGGYSGPKCIKKTDLCEGDPCKHGNCVPYGDVRYQCECQEGYTGTNCETNIDECFMNKNGCLYGGVCVDGVNHYTCDCPSGFTGDHCQVQDDLCKSDDCTNGLCLNDYSNNKPKCICEEPYQTDTKGECNKKIDHCMTSNCSTNTDKCESSLDGFTCQCNTGYEGSLCQHSQDDCASNPCVNGTCTDGLGTYNCTCQAGWEGTNCDENIDDCTNMCNDSNTLNCTDLVNGYMCYCKPGYTGKNCSDEIDECSSLPCQHGATCTDLHAGFKCNCTEGWAGKICSDQQDYCNDSMCSNNGVCYNIKDTFYCRCNPGTQGDRCETSPQVCNLIHPCTEQGQCNETQGTAHCTCNTNYTGVSCSLIQDSCNNNPCVNGGTCLTETIGYKCECADGYRGDRCEEEIPVCDNGACQNAQTCEKEGRQKYCVCPAKKVSVGTSCKDGSLDFDLWFDNQIESSGVKSGQPFKLNRNGNMTVIFWLGLLKDISEGTIFQIKNNMDSETFLEVKTGGISFKGSADILMKVTIGQWNHIAITWLSTGDYELIINGIKSSFGKNSTPEFQDGLLRLEFDRKFSGYVSQLTVWGKVLTFTEILNFINDPKYLSDMALGWYDYHLTKAAWQLTPSLAKSGEKLCDTDRVMDSSCDNKKDKVVPSADNCPTTAFSKVSEKRTIQVSNVFSDITFDEGNVTTSLNSELFTWGAYQVVYASTDEAGNIGDCRFKAYVKKQECDANSYSSVQPCNSEGIQDFCPSKEKPAMPWPNIINCGVLGSYNRYNPFEKPDQPACGGTEVQKKTVTLEIKYSMALMCDAVKKDLLVSKVESAFQSLESSWNGLTNKLKVSGSCSTPATNNVSIKAEFSSLSSSINGLPPFEIIKQAVLETKLLEGKDFKDVANAEPLKNEAVFKQFASCDSEAYAVVGTDCVQCGSGSFFDAASKQCTLCPIGTYSESPGKDSCENCTSDKTTLRKGSQASNDCIDKCPAGQYLKNSACVDCPRDYYQSEEGKDYCHQCPLGKRTKDPKTNSSDKCFDDCPSGTDLHELGNCTDCKRGYYRTQGQQDTCTKCDEGNTTRGTKTTSKKYCDLPDCPMGMFINDTAPASCVPCTFGEYQPNKWMFECLKCNESYTTKSENSTSADDCKFYCEDGYEEESAENKTCRLCPRGTYRTNKGSERFELCKNCSQNTTDGPGAKTSSECSIPICTAGQIIKNNQCKNCEVDKYQPVSFPNTTTECMPCTTGFGTKTENSTTEEYCEPVCSEGEQFNATGKSCEPCPQGYWKNESSAMRFEQCEQCTENYTTEGEGSTNPKNCSIRDCQVGTKIINNTDCEPCPFGYYQDQPRQNECKSCDTNRNTSSTGATNKGACTISCHPGYEGPTGNCEECKDDYVKEFNGNGQCSQCNENRTSNTNHTACTGVVYCAIGAGYSSSKKDCHLCDFGSHKSIRGNFDCEKCPDNYTTDHPGSTSSDDCNILFNCVPGFFGLSGQCEPCHLGSYKSTDGIENCTSCNQTMTTTNNASTAESDCSVVVCSTGSYRTDKNKCELCAIGQYQPESGQSNCIACTGHNFTTNTTGSTKEDECLKVCNKGEYRKTRETCAACDLGLYQPKEGQEKCLNCSSTYLYTTLNTSSISVDQCLRICDEGNYRSTSDRTKCIKCEIGTYQPVKGKTTCIQCGKDMTTLQEGSASNQSCMPICGPGKHLNMTDRICQQCELGTYKNTTGIEQQCDPCPEKNTTVSVGSTSEDQCILTVCEAGSYRKSGETGCSKCEENFYQDKKSALSCKKCPEGSITLITGATSVKRCIMDCPSGEEYNGISKKCVNCTVGEYRLKLKSDKCLTCPKGQTSTQKGSSKCVALIGKPKPVGHVKIAMTFSFKVSSCANVDQVLGAIRKFIENIAKNVCSIWNVSCKINVKFKNICGKRRRRKREGYSYAVLEIDNVPEVLNNNKTDQDRTAKGVFTDAFSIEQQPDDKILKDNNIEFQSLEEVQALKTCIIGSVLQNDLCVQCERGKKYLNVTSCVPCDGNMYQDKQGQLECKECPGITSPSPNKTNCISKCEAELNYCQNGGSCKIVSEERVYCDCPSPYFGDTCENRGDLSSESQMGSILGGAIGGGAVLLFILAIIFGIVGWKRTKYQKECKKYASSYTAEFPPFMSAMKPMPMYSSRSHHLNPAYDNGVYDPM